MSEKVYGIDLGTTYSCVAAFEEGEGVRVLENREGDATTPSVVWFDGRRSARVGSAAKEQWGATPGDVVVDVKRLMGTGAMVTARGETYRPETVSALILKKLAQDAGLKAWRAKPKVVITCPAYFGQEAREATRNAGKMAGLDVVAIIDEPMAAATCYGMDQLQGKCVLVFDLGGGTFDATVIQVQGGDIRAIATGGIRRLGGRDWDRELALHFLARYCEETGADYGRSKQDKGFMAELEMLAEKRKRQLSSMGKVRVSIAHGGRTCSFELTRAEFDEKTSDLLDRAVSEARKVVEEAERKPGFRRGQMEVLMVGGSTKMPQVAAALKEAFGKNPVGTEGVNPDEAVARGAAWYARQQTAGSVSNGAELFLEGRRHEELNLPGKVTIRPVASKSYGPRFVRDEWDRVGFICNMIVKNTEVPCTSERPSSTVSDWQTAIKWDIYENEVPEAGGMLTPNDPQGGGVKIGSMEMTGLTPRPKGETSAMVYMELNAEGLLHAKGVEIPHGGEDPKVCEVTIRTSHGMTDREIEEAKRLVEAFEVE